MTPVKVLIVDDEQLARQRIRRLLARERDVEIVGECASGRDALAAIRGRAPDVVFLDVQLPNGDGFSVLRALAPEETPIVIFVTAFDEHAVRAFDVHAADYLLKPFEEGRLRSALARARAQLEHAEASARHARLLAALGAVDGGGPPVPAAPSRYAERLMVKADERLYFVKVEELVYAEADGNYVRLHAAGRTHVVRETLTALERRLDPSRFARIHRSTVVNLDRVREMQPWFSGDYVVILDDGTQLKFSRSYRDRLEQRLRPRP